jgi:hypothetical protein
MTAARAAKLGLVAALLGAGGLPATTARAAETTPDEALAASHARPATYPLVFLLQGDALLASEPDAANAGAGTSADGPDGSALRLRRLRVGDDARAGAWRVRATLEASSRGQAHALVEGGRIPPGVVVRLTEAFGAWIPHRALALSVGAQRVPFSLSRLVDEAELRLPERAQITAALAPDYRAGVSVESDLGLLDARLAFFGADTTYDRNLFTAGTLGVFRLSAEPIGPMGVTPWRRRVDDPWYDWARFSAGLSIAYGTLLEAKTLALEGDAQFQWRRFTATAEYVGEHAALPLLPGQTSTLRWPHQGLVVEPGVFLIPEHLELVLRGAWYRRPLDITASPDDTTDTLAGGGGLTLFAHAAHVRLQAAFELRRTLRAELPDSSWAIFRATFAL